MTRTRLEGWSSGLLLSVCQNTIYQVLTLAVTTVIRYRIRVAVRRVVAFRLDRNPMICRDRVALLRHFNPDVRVHGIFGGDPGCRRTTFRLLGRQLLRLDSLYISQHPGRWNWKNGDLALLDWFRDVGCRLSFDVLHLVEWDLVLAGPLGAVYSAVPPDAVGLTAFTPLTEIGGDWRWTSEPAERQEWDQLVDHVRARHGYVATPHGCLGVGPCFPRAFLDAYAAADPPDFGNDEVRLPLYAKALGFPVVNTGFRARWHDADADRFFNGVGHVIDPEVVVAELKRRGGLRAFHPVVLACTTTVLRSLRESDMGRLPLP